ncbi:hypothetical protein H4582DRAFT_2060366 [Lactarius indigo]|nr:hypothetical protein H4582DRAFT_2060366 [Lactarius indigo]
MGKARTGSLTLTLSPFVHKYDATGIPALVPLLRKNVFASASATVFVTTFDGLPPGRYYIYHPVLLRPLALDADRSRDALHVIAVVVAKLRAENVLQESLQG